MSALFDDPDLLRVDSQEHAIYSFDQIQEALDRVAFKRAYVGSMQLRSDYMLNSIDNRITNLGAANASLTDTNIARESVEFARHSVLASVAVGVVAAQTKNLNSGLLTLLIFDDLTALNELVN